MGRKHRTAVKVSAVLFCGALFLGACGDDSDGDGNGGQEGDPGISPTSLLDDEIDAEDEGGVDVSVEDDGEVDVDEEDDE